MYDEALGLYPTLTPRYMAVTPTALSYSALASSKSLQVTSTETPWEIENEIDWISTSPTSGSSSASVNVGVTENKSGDDARTGIFYLKSNGNFYLVLVFYDYDEECDAYYCKMSLDEDEMASYVSGYTRDCKYYRFYDEYKSVQKQI